MSPWARSVVLLNFHRHSAIKAIASAQIIKLISQQYDFEITEDFRLGRTDFTKKNQATYIPICSRNNDVYAKFSVVWLPGSSNLDWELRN